MAFQPYDLTDVLTAQPDGPALPVSYRQGIIQEWNPVTLQNKVLVGGATMVDLPVQGVAEVASFAPGAVVTIATTNKSWAILGRFVLPATPDATDAITQLGQRVRTAAVATQENTNNLPYVDLATPGPSIPDVLIPASGKVEVGIAARIGTFNSGQVGVAITGATTINPSEGKSLLISAVSSIAMNASRKVVFSGLPAGGKCTFTLKYGADGTNDAFFSEREITVEAL